MVVSYNLSTCIPLTFFGGHFCTPLLYVGVHPYTFPCRINVGQYVMAVLGGFPCHACCFLGSQSYLLSASVHGLHTSIYNEITKRRLWLSRVAWFSSSAALGAKPPRISCPDRSSLSRCNCSILQQVVVLPGCCLIVQRVWSSSKGIVPRQFPSLFSFRLQAGKSSSPRGFPRTWRSANDRVSLQYLFLHVAKFFFLPHNNPFTPTES